MQESNAQLRWAKTISKTLYVQFCVSLTIIVAKGRIDITDAGCLARLCEKV